MNDKKTGSFLFDKSNWKTVRLGEVGRTYSGLTGKKKEDFGQGNAKYITFLNVLNNTCIDTALLEAVSIGENEKQYAIRKGDLFFNTSSEIPEEVGMCAMLANELRNTYLNSFCFGYRLFDQTICPLYLVYYFNGQKGRRIMNILAQGATRYNLSKERFLDIKITIPPIEEQYNIISTISAIDTHITNLQKLISKQEAIKKATLKLLLTPKPGWKRVRLGDVATEVKDRIPYARVTLSNYVSTENLLPNAEGKVEALSIPFLGSCVHFKKGDILVSNIRPYLKKIWLADFEGGCSSDIIVYRTSSNVTSNFLYQILFSDSFFDYAMTTVSGTKMPRGDRKMILLYEFSLPSSGEQYNVASILHKIDSMLLNLKKQLSKVRQIKTGAMSYFFG